MKHFLATLFFVLLSLGAWAQSALLKASAVDSSSREAVAGAVAQLILQKDGAKPRFTTTDAEGAFSFRNLPYGRYTLKITFMGYEDVVKDLTVKTPRIDLGVIAMNEGVEIETVVKEVKAIRTSQRGDTVSYNADAFKVVADADVEGLLKKMPGITVRDGKIEAQGEEVKKVLVDGKEFFGEDVTTAIKSLPAETVNYIEVYNKLSDAAEFSGMDDGEGFKALNIVTHAHMKNGMFGKFYGGMGYDADTKTEDEVKYVAGGNFNMFQGDSRLSVIGLFNNINQQNFSFEDIMGVTGKTGGAHGGRHGTGQYMVRPQDGVATVNAVGVNFSDAWGKRNQVTFEGSYFFNNTRTINRTSLSKWYEAPIYRVDTLQTRGYSNTLGNNHRFDGRVEWKISDNQSLMIRPKFSYQSNDPLSYTTGWQYGAPANGGSGYSRTNNFSDRTSEGTYMSAYMVYRAKLGKDGRTITLDGYGRYSDFDGNTCSSSNMLGMQPDRPDTDPETGAWLEEGYYSPRYLRSTSPSQSYSIRGNATYTEPLSKHWQASLQYRFSYDDKENNKRAYLTGEDYSIEGLMPDGLLSDSYTSHYTRQNIGPGIRYAKKRSSFVANVYYQNSRMKGEAEKARLAGDNHIDKSFDNVTYFIMGRLNINRANSLRLYINSYTSSPRVTDLQNVYDVSNAQNIIHGNPDLNPAYTHQIRFHYTNSNMEKGRTFMWMLSFRAIQDFNATHLIQNPGEVVIDGKSYRPNYYSMPVNLDGYRQLYTQWNYGFPVGFLKSNLNLTFGLNYTNTPSIMGGEIGADGLVTGGVKTDTYNMGYMSSAVLGSNISENVDFTLSWNGTYNEAQNDYRGEKIKNRYFNHTAEANMKFILPLGFTFTGSVAYSQYLGFTNDYDDSFTLCNLWIGKKLFKNGRGELMVGVNDVFNQNKGFVRTTGSGWTQNALNSVIGRYYMVQLTYNLRHFGKRGSRNMKDYEGMDRLSRGGGRPPFGHGGSGAGKPHYHGMY